MANQPAHPAQHQAQHSAASPKAESKKADPAQAQYVVNLSPEQYDQAVKQDAPPPEQMEVGGTGTAKVSFVDVKDADVPIASSTWTSTDPSVVTVTADDKDPTSAKLEAIAAGRAIVKADVVSQGGKPAEASVEVMVIETGTPATGTIELSIQGPTKAKAKAA